MRPQWSTDIPQQVHFQAELPLMHPQPVASCMPDASRSSGGSGPIPASFSQPCQQGQHALTMPFHHSQGSAYGSHVVLGYQPQQWHGAQMYGLPSQQQSPEQILAAEMRQPSASNIQAMHAQPAWSQSAGWQASAYRNASSAHSPQSQAVTNHSEYLRALHGVQQFMNPSAP